MWMLGPDPGRWVTHVRQADAQIAQSKRSVDAPGQAELRALDCVGTGRPTLRQKAAKRGSSL